MILKNLIHESFESRLGIGYPLAVVAEIEYGNVVVFLAKPLEDSAHDVAGQNTVNTNAVARFFNSQRLGEGADGAFCGTVYCGPFLAYSADQAAHVDYAALRFPQMRQGLLAGDKITYEVRLQNLREIILCEIVYALEAGMVPRVIDETVQSAV